MSAAIPAAEAAACPGDAPAGASPSWPEEGAHRIPFAVYTDAALHQRELERFFYQGHWSYVGLEAEIPKPGDFAHRRGRALGHPAARPGWTGARGGERLRASRRAVLPGAPRQPQRVRLPVSPMELRPAGQPDRRAVPARRQAGRQVNGGMPPDFKPEEHGLTKLAVACRNGVVFASFDHEVEPLEDYLGPDILQLRPRLRWPRAGDPWLQPPAHPATGS